MLFNCNDTKTGKRQLHIQDLANCYCKTLLFIGEQLSYIFDAKIDIVGVKSRQTELVEEINYSSYTRRSIEIPDAELWIRIIFLFVKTEGFTKLLFTILFHVRLIFQVSFLINDIIFKQLLQQYCIIVCFLLYIVGEI